MKTDEGEPSLKMLLIIIVSALFLVNFCWAYDRLTARADKSEEQPTLIQALTSEIYYSVGFLRELSTPRMDTIMECESNNDPTAKNPRSSAFGRCQMLKQTREYVERKWHLTFNWQDPEQQGYACERLLREEGTRHWNSTRFCWGS